MQLSLDIGTLNITDKEVASFIENRSVDEIKVMILEFFKNQAKDSSLPKKIKPKGKWGAFADRMSGLTNPKITEHIQKTSLEMRDNFELRDLNR